MGEEEPVLAVDEDEDVLLMWIIRVSRVDHPLDRFGQLRHITMTQSSIQGIDQLSWKQMDISTKMETHVS
jgi:hypothetical protein